MLIMLETIAKVKEFIAISHNVLGDVTLKSGKYVIDGKSLLGIFSLNLSEPVELICENDTDYDAFKKFIA